MSPRFPEPPFTIAEKFHVEKVLGKGGMGVVYKARQDPLNRFVAIKMILGDLNDDAEFVGRFKQEAITLAGLNHPGITQVYDVVDYENKTCLVIEFVEGQTLDTLMTGPPLPTPLMLDLGEKMAEALAFCHDRGIIHRDIKPENIMMLEKNRVKIMDFGIAKGAENLVKTQTGCSIGTPKYMSPEQAQGKRLLTPASDVYSLACVLYQMVTGYVPFDGDQSIAIALAHVREVPQPPRAFNPTLPIEVEELILRCLAKVPEERPASMHELGRKLKDLSRQYPLDESAPWPGGGDFDDATNVMPSSQGEAVPGGTGAGGVYRGTTQVGGDATQGRSTLPRSFTQSPTEVNGTNGGSGYSSSVPGSQTGSTSLALPQNPRSFMALYGVLISMIVLIGAVGIYIGRLQNKVDQAGQSSGQTVAVATPVEPTPTPPPSMSREELKELEMKIEADYSSWFLQAKRRLDDELGIKNVADPSARAEMNKGLEILYAGQRKAPNSAKIQRYIGEHFFQTDQRDRAIEYFERVLNNEASGSSDITHARNRMNTLEQLQNRN